jgi:hypothetical protein
MMSNDRNIIYGGSREKIDKNEKKYPVKKVRVNIINIQSINL